MNIIKLIEGALGATIIITGTFATIILLAIGFHKACEVFEWFFGILRKYW